jgi:hypothetical protein
MRAISTMIKEASQAFFDTNKFFPELVIIFRDGVGEG